MGGGWTSRSWAGAVGALVREKVGLGMTLKGWGGSMLGSALGEEFSNLNR